VIEIGSTDPPIRGNPKKLTSDDLYTIKENNYLVHTTEQAKWKEA